MSNSIRSNMDTEPYDGSAESGHNKEMIICLSIIAALITAIPVILLTRYFVLKRAIRKRAFEAMSKRHAHKVDDDNDWYSMHDDIAELPETSSRPASGNHARHPEQGSMQPTYSPQDTDAAVVGKKEEGETKEEAPRGMWETVARRVT